MECPSCAQPNAKGAKFCAACGTRLLPTCLTCGAPHSPAQRFCSECGRHLAPSTPAPEEESSPSTKSVPGAPPVQHPGERRHLTVMFSDLVGSTSLSDRLDPEDLTQVVRGYQEACWQVIAPLGGTIAQYLGDGILVYFGYPQAHEDDAYRAVLAALHIAATVPTLTIDTASGSVRLSVRIGIHSGLVVVGDTGPGSRYEPLVLGKTPNLAARLQDLASPNGVMISGETHRLIGDRFRCRDLGMRVVRGLAEPIPVFEVLGETKPAIDDTSTPPSRGELIGREHELAILRECWEQVSEGSSQAVLLGGEAGIGKSRLIEGFKQELAPDSYILWDCRCSPYHQDSALHPIIDAFGREFELESDDTAAVRLTKISARLEALGLASPDLLPAWAALLSIPLPEADSAPELSPGQQKRKVFEAIGAVLQAVASRRPLLFVVEDVHWADASTLELLAFLMNLAPAESVLLLVVFRPEFRATWRGRVHSTHLTLNRLTRKHTELMIQRMAGGKAMPPAVLQQIAQRTDGIPLFIEELTKMLLESGSLRELEDRYELTRPLRALGIPSTLQDSLMARLDRLGAVKDLAQLCAVLGRSFPYELLRGVATVDDPALQVGLARLVEAGLLQHRGPPHRRAYSFKHVMIQEAAYASLLKDRRRRYHERIARALAQRLAEARGTEPELVAHHFAEAGFPEEGSRYYHMAAELAVARSAHVEAVGHLGKSLELLKSLPETGERRERELGLEVAMGAALIAAKGYAAADVERAYSRARELCKQVGDTRQLFPVLRGLAAFYYVRGQLPTARELGEQLLSLAQSQDDVTLRIGANLELGSTLFNEGEFIRAQQHFVDGVTSYGSARNPSRPTLYGQDLGVSCLSRLATALACLGYLDQALTRSDQALRLAESLSHPYSVAYALSFAAVVRRLRGEAAVVRELADSALGLSREHEFPFWGSVASMLNGWALVELGQPDVGIEQMRNGLESWRALGTGVSTGYFLTELAEGYQRVGRPEEGLELVAEAMDLGKKTGDRWYESPLHRIKGDLLLGSVKDPSRSKVDDEAEQCFRQAIDIAQVQQARMFQLAAVTRLSALWRDRGRGAEARTILTGILAWFGEGHETLWLRSAKSLLDSLPLTEAPLRAAGSPTTSA